LTPWSHVSSFYLWRAETTLLLLNFLLYSFCAPLSSSPFDFLWDIFTLSSGNALFYSIVSQIKIVINLLWNRRRPFLEQSVIVFFSLNTLAYMDYQPVLVVCGLGFYSVLFLFTRVEIFFLCLSSGPGTSSRVAPKNTSKSGKIFNNSSISPIFPILSSIFSVWRYSFCKGYYLKHIYFQKL